MPNPTAASTRPVRKRPLPSGPTTAEASPKRPKATPDAPADGPPPTASKNLIRFSGVAPTFDIDVYTHPTATHLFGQTLADFKIASRVFWIACSANVRGVEPKTKEQLLADQAKIHKKNWHELDEYKSAWNGAYDEIVARYEIKVLEFVTKYMGSPAGKSFKSDVDAKRRQHVAIPEFHIDYLSEYKGKKGVEFGMTQVYEIFDILEELWTSIKFTIPVDDHTEVENTWFECDDKALNGGNTTKNDSWFYRLYQTARSLVTQFVLVQCTSHTSLAVDKNVYVKILKHIPTPPRLSDNTYPPFPCMSDSLPEWVKLYSDGSEANTDEEAVGIIPDTPKYTAQTKIIDEQRGEYDALESSGHGLAPVKLQRVVQQSNAESAKGTEVIRENLSVAGLTPLPIPMQLDYSEIPPAPFYSPSLTPTEYALVAGNNIMRMGILMELAKQEKCAWTNMKNSCRRQELDWDKKIMLLAEQQQAIQDLMGDVSGHMGRIEQKGRIIDAQEESIERYLDSHPSSKSLLDREVSRNRERKLFEVQQLSSSIFPNAVQTPPAYGSPINPNLTGRRFSDGFRTPQSGLRASDEHSERLGHSPPANDILQEISKVEMENTTREIHGLPKAGDVRLLPPAPFQSDGTGDKESSDEVEGE